MSAIGKHEWGPRYWYAMHLAAAHCVADQPVSAQVLGFYRALPSAIPCDMCRGHYEAWLATHPVEAYADSGDRLLRWTYDLHDSVNQRNGTRSPSYDSVVAYYRRGQLNALPSSPSSSASLNSVIVPLVILVAVLGVAAWLMTRRERVDY